MPAAAIETGFDFHEEVLNLLLLETAHSSIANVAQQIDERVRKMRAGYAASSTVPWLQGMPSQENAKKAAGWERLDEFYNPRTFVCLGEFDLASFYLSPSLYELFPPTGDLPQVGQHVHMCLLPRRRAGADHNGVFVKLYKRPAQSPLPPSERFAIFIKLKLNVPRTWPAGDVRSVTPIHEILDAVWNTIDRWKDRYGAAAAACVGLCLGWGELVVVAHADSVGKLIRLLWQLRMQSGPCPWPDAGHAHDFATSVSYIAYDHAIDVHAARLFREECGGPNGQRWDPHRLVTAAREVSRGFPAEPSPIPVYFAPTFASYPGHEASIAELLRKADAEFREKWLGEGTKDPNTSTPGLMGKYDVGYPIFTTVGRVTETDAFCYIALLQLWVLRDKTDPLAQEGPLHFFRSSTQVGLISLADDPEHERPPFPAEHTVRKATQPPLPDCETLDDGLRGILHDILDHLRILQVPYARSKQIITLLTKFHWTTRHDVLWEDSLTLAPLVFCLRGHLRMLVDLWNTWSLEEWPGDDDLQYPRRSDLRMAQEIYEVLARFHDVELPELLAAFRSNFNQRHLGGYLTEATPDFNLFHIASVQQLLNITNMTLDSLVDTVLGPRACVARIGDASSPKVLNVCEVILTELNSDTLNFPLLLETLGHEVGHCLMWELRKAYLEPQSKELSYDPNVWSKGCKEEESYRELQKAFSALCEGVFHGAIDVTDSTMEVASDLVEMQLFGYDDLDPWLQSFMLRQLLASSPVTQDAKSSRPSKESRPLVPTPNKEVMRGALKRAVLVAAAKRLAEHAEPIADDDDYRAYEEFQEALHAEHESMRRCLYEKCIVGPSLEVIDTIRFPERWEEFREDSLRHAPWINDPHGLELARKLFRALHDHIAQRGKRLEQAGISLWPQIRKEFVELRDRQLPHLIPTLLIRHWLGREKSWSVDRETLLAEKRPEGLPWRVVVQPTAEYEGFHDTGQPPEFRTVLLQRGRVVPSTMDASREMCAAGHHIVGNLMARLPAWRQLVLSRIGRLEGKGTTA